MKISVNSLTALYILYGLITGDSFYMLTQVSEVSTKRKEHFYALVEHRLIEELTR